MDPKKLSDDSSIEEPIESLIDTLDKKDPGDQVLRKFRYQFAYGVILLVGAANKPGYCKALWCEQYEDIILQREDGLFDAYQIKTRKPELGYWDLNDDALWESMARFVRLNAEYKECLGSFNFVTNTDFLDSSAKDRGYLSPKKLIEAIQSVDNWNKLKGNARKGFGELRKKIKVDSNKLFDVLKKTNLIVGPTEAAFEDELTHTHLSTLKDCSTFTTNKLRRLRDVLIAKVAQASSLVTDDADKHLSQLLRNGSKNAYLMAKSISVEDLKIIIREVSDSPFRYSDELATLGLGDLKKKLDKLEKKMKQGGLAHHYEMMKRRSISAEQILIDLATRPEDGVRILSQIENVVLSICDDTYLRLSHMNKQYGATMLIEIQDQLKQLALTNPKQVCEQDVNLLIGVAGLLTSECKVWWSEKFQLEELS